METSNDITVEVAYAIPFKQKVVRLSVAKETSVRDAIQRSGIHNFFRNEQFETCEVGIFGNVLGKRNWPTVDDYQLDDGDRIEIYRPLRK